jgi:hypothetical protein
MRLRIALLGIATIALDGCAMTLAREHPLLCPLGEQRLVRDTLYFGMTRPGGGAAISADDWRSFVDGKLAIVFPNGFTIVDATGQWRGADGAIAREPSKLVSVLHPDDPASEHGIADVIHAYQLRFAQESVLRERSAVCARF